MAAVLTQRGVAATFKQLSFSLCVQGNVYAWQVVDNEPLIVIDRSGTTVMFTAADKGVLVLAGRQAGARGETVCIVGRLA